MIERSFTNLEIAGSSHVAEKDISAAITLEISVRNDLTTHE